MEKRLSDALLILGILIFAFFLLTFRLSELFPFIGDQGWFYLSARDMIIHGKIPLVGITTSHIWLHHGAIFTYMLAIALWLFSFNPLAGAFVTIPITLGAIFLLYILGSTMFDNRVGLVAALLFATSPLVLIHTRMAYHTSPLAFCSTLFALSLYTWINGRKKILPLVTFSLALLYNFEISTFVFFGIFIIVIIYGHFKKRGYISSVNKRILVLSCITFFIPMLPMLTFDILHGFPQTIKFAVWVVYKVIIGATSGSLTGSGSGMLHFIAVNYKRLLFVSNGFVAFIIFFMTFLWVLMKFIILNREKKLNPAWILLLLWILVPLGGELINHTTTEAHLIVLYPPVILLTSLLLVSFMKNVLLRIVIISLIIIIVISNVSFMIKNEYLMGGKGGYGPKFSDRVKVAKSIVDTAQGKRYNLKGEGTGSQFESFTMNYEYLTWWLGNGPVKKKEKLVFVLRDTEDRVVIEKKHD